ncbi:DUF2190 family protein [Methyloversatilis sp. XJ19-49]|uniref:DUF2190 family protein n=1 Tax=Methyloversatilis sp. XJ19-49 TaxID=2963429 RepID=UPI00211CAA44|nr:DUF2190 family protein [Methyloversatilis sp. XJ19-49]MCQ9378813.1 DUF2190 family protein [Methyloversatilis sp. XJ19-49]
MRNEGLQKTLIAGAAVNPNRIVKFGSADTQAVQAAAATDKSMGVSDNLGAASGETFDVIVDGIALVKYGGNVAAGDLLTSDANGQAIATTTASNRVIGIAMLSGVSGDIGSVRIAPGSV